MNITKVIKNNHSLVFIGVNIFVAFLGFVRSFAFMKFFDFKELGIVTLVSTAASLIGMFQIGLINGGYRIIALGDSDSNIKVNNVLFSYFGILALLLAAFSVFVYILGFYTNWFILLIINVMGICMLLTNWLTNTLIGASEFKRLNVANSISAFASLLCLLLAYYFGLYGALLSLLIQPIIFVSVVFLTDNKEIPTKFDLDFTYIKYILTFGFIPYLSGIFFLLYMQIERWSVNAFLGPEALGKMYLVFLTITLWVLVPTSILNLFFPKAIKFYSENDLVNFNKVIKLNSAITLAYCLGLCLIIFALASPLVKLIFPKHIPYVYLVVLALPGLVFRTLADPISLYLNSIVRLKPLFWSDVFSLFVYLCSILFLFYFKLFSLSNIVICFNVYFCFKFFFLLTISLKTIKN
jgi:O-antigen/teichoic acid export membrane protein